MDAKHRVRLRIAQESARIIVEEGIRDYLTAKQKAATRLGLEWSRQLPRNEEIEQAISEYHRLYRSTIQPSHITRLRRIALEAMQFFEAFSPRLVGSVLDGTAGDFSPITLHLFTETTEEIIWKLLEAGIPFTEKSHDVQLGKGQMERYPVFYFIVDDTEVELFVYPQLNLHQTPKGKGKALQRASINAVRQLIQLEQAE